MSANDTDISLPVPTAALQAAVEAALSEHGGRRVAVARLDRRPSLYRSSFATEELDLVLDDGSQLRLIWKDASRRALSAEAVDAKPIFLYDPSREIEVYRFILEPGKFGTPRCFGALVDSPTDRYWLFLERVDGLELTRIGDLSGWQDVARWLARFHNHFAAIPPPPVARRHLLVQDRRYLEHWMGRACEFLQQRQPAVSASDLRCIERLAERYDRVVARLSELPANVIHGEFFASNILVDRSGSKARICPVDWEMTAVGPRGLDLAALVAGRWTDDQRRALAMAYWEEATALDSAHCRPGDFLTDLKYCRLQLAVQMLGWSATWRPQPDHAHDWLSDAIHLAVELLGAY